MTGEISQQRFFAPNLLQPEALFPKQIDVAQRTNPDQYVIYVHGDFCTTASMKQSTARTNFLDTREAVHTLWKGDPRFKAQSVENLYDELYGKADTVKIEAIQQVVVNAMDACANSPDDENLKALLANCVGVNHETSGGIQTARSSGIALIELVQQEMAGIPVTDSQLQKVLGLEEGAERQADSLPLFSVSASVQSKLRLSTGHKDAALRVLGKNTEALFANGVFEHIDQSICESNPALRIYDPTQSANIVTDAKGSVAAYITTSYRDVDQKVCAELTVKIDVYADAEQPYHLDRTAVTVWNRPGTPAIDTPNVLGRLLYWLNNLFFSRIVGYDERHIVPPMLAASHA